MRKIGKLLKEIFSVPLVVLFFLYCLLVGEIIFWKKE